MRYLFLILIVCSGLIAKSQNTASWSLQDCINYAITHNISVQKKVLDKESADINYKQSVNNKLPSVNGSASLNTSHGSTIDPITSSFLDQTIYSNSFGVNGQLVLYQGNSLNLQIEKNALLVNQSTLYQQQAANNITLSVIQAYLQALYYYEGIGIAKNAAASSAEELKLAEIKFKNGAIAQKDLADVQTQHAQNEYSVVAAQNLYNQQVLTLKQLLELEPGTDFGIKAVALDSTNEAIPDKQTVYQQAIQHLPDLKIYDVQKDILGKELSIAKAGNKPTLSLSAGVNTGYTNTMDYNYITQIHRNFSQQAGLTLSIPIFSKYTNKTNIALAKINIKQNELDKQSSAKTLYANIETAWQNAIANNAQQASAKVARDNAELAYDLARKKYDFGGLTTTELAVSRNSYLSAEQTYLQTKYMANLYRSLLDFYTGENL